MSVKIPIVSTFDGRGIEKAVNQFKELDTAGQKASFVLKKSFLPATAALGALAVVGEKAVSMASDLVETQNKVGVIFGSSAQSVQKFAETANQALGQTQNEALTAASTFGTFGKAAGLAGQDLASFSTDFVTLASDLASFNNSTPEEATLALGAALRGEAEPLRRFGVLLDDATLKQKATELGIYKGSGALTAQQKILAAQKAIMEQTTDAQGDFARTSDDLANQQRILKATLEDTATKIGMALLPAVQAVLPLLTAFADWASNNTGVILGIGTAIAAIATAIVATNVAMAAWKAVSAITIGINYALAASFTAVQIATGIGIATVIAGIAAFALYKRQMNGLKGELAATTKPVKDVSDSLDRMSQSTRSASLSAKTLIPDLKATGSGADTMKQKIDAARKAIEDKFNKALDDAKEKLEKAKEAYTSFSQDISRSLTNNTSFTAVYDAGKETGQSFIQGITEQTASVKAFAKKVQVLLQNGLSESALQQVLNAGLEAGSAIADELITGGTDAIKQTNELLQSLQELADSVGKQAADKFYLAGVTQGEALVAGIESVVKNYQGILKNPNLTLKQLTGISNQLDTDLAFAGITGTSAVAAPSAEGLSQSIGDFMAQRQVGLAQGNYTVNVNGGLDSSAAIGQAVVNAIRSFNRTNGPAQIAVSSY